MKVVQDERSGMWWFHVGDRRWPCVIFRKEDQTVPFNDGREMTYRTRQVLIRFESGWEVSVIWGSMTYSDNKWHPHGWHGDSDQEFVEEPNTVEVAIITRSGKLAGDDVFGNVDADALNDLLDRIAVLPSNADELPEV